MHAWIWVATGLVVGWLARTLTRSRGYGFFSDLLLGLLGGVVGGWTFRVAGLTQRGDHANHAIVAFFGAMVVIGGSRLLRPVARDTQRLLHKTAPGAGLEARIRQMGERDRAIFARLLHRDHPLRNPNVAFDEQLTFGQRLADRVAAFGDSWRFIGLFLLFMLVWMVLNTETGVHFDAFPFILLNLILSCLAALQAPVIMMSQNRQAASKYTPRSTSIS